VTQAATAAVDHDEDLSQTVHAHLASGVGIVDLFDDLPNGVVLPA